MKIIPASDGAVRWVAIAFFICAQAAVCLPVGEFSVRIPPCQLLTLTTDTGKWSPSGKPMVFYTLEGRDFTTATNAAAADVCKGTVTLRVGAVLNALVYVRRDATQAPFSVVMETSVGDNETVLYTCQDSSTGCVQLENRASVPGVHHIRRSVHLNDDIIIPTTPNLLTSTLSVTVGVASLLGLTIALTMCAKGSSSFEPIDPIPLSTGNKTATDVTETTQETPTDPVTSNPTFKLTASIASDNVPLLGEGGGVAGTQPVEPTPCTDGTASNQVVEITDSLAQSIPSGAPIDQNGPLTSDSAVAEPAKGSQGKVHVVTGNMMVEDGFPYASVSSGSGFPYASVSSGSGFPYASVSSGSGVTSKAEITTLEPAKTITVTANMVVEDGFPYASVSTGTEGNKSTEVNAIPVSMVVEDGFPYASVSAGTSSKTESTTSEPTRAAVAITTSKVTKDGHPYASVSDVMINTSDSASRHHRSSSSSDATDSAGPGVGSKLLATPTQTGGRARSLTTPESLGLSASSGASSRLSSHQPLPAIPRQISDLLDEVYDIIPEGLEEDNMEGVTAPPPRVYDAVVASERKPDRTYESVSDHPKPTPSPPSSPKVGGVMSPKKGGASDGRMRALTTFFKKKKDVDDHSSSSPPHAPTIPLPLPPLAPPETTSPHRQLDKTMSLPSSARGAGLAMTQMPLPSSARGAGLAMAQMSVRVHLPLPALPEDSGGSGSDAATVGPKPRTMEPDDPRYDLVPTEGGEERGKEEEPGYDTVQRVLQLVEDDAQSINLGVEGGEEPGYDSIKRADILKVKGAQAIEPLEDDPAYDKVKKEGVGQEVEPAEEPGYAKVDRDLIESILASHQNEPGDQASANEVITLGYAKVTKDPTLTSGDHQSSLAGLQQSDEMGYAIVPSKASRKESSGNLPVAHDDQGYALVPSELKEARRAASLKERRVSLKKTQEEVVDTFPVQQASDGLKPSTGGPGDQLSTGPPPGGQMKPSASDTLYSKVNVEFKHELRKQRQSYNEDTPTQLLLPPLPSSPDQPSPTPLVPPPLSSAVLEFPDLDSPLIPLHSDAALQLVTESPYATVGKPSVPPAIEAMGYAQVGTHAILRTTTPPHESERVKNVALGYDTVGEVTTRVVTCRDEAGYDVVGHLERHVKSEPLNKDQLEDKVLGYDVVGKAS